MWSTSSISPIPQKSAIISATKTLHIFNPEHDYALAVGAGSYTAPASVVRLKEHLSLLPALYADNGDFILISRENNNPDSDSKEFGELIKKKNLMPVSPDRLLDILNEVSAILPWGWNYNLKSELLSIGVEETLLPDDSFLASVRTLSHRRTALHFKKQLYEEMPEIREEIGQEIFTEDEAELYLRSHPHAFFKAPWSSSGRGIVSSRHISLQGLREWTHGIIRRQGSIIAEPGWEKKLDFATEWCVTDSGTQFLGYSVFETSQRGKYHKNVRSSQSNLEKYIKGNTLYSDRIRDIQKILIDRTFVSSYRGPLGIDMLADVAGRVNPCVEINLRLTMGHIFLENLKPHTLCWK